MSHSSAAEAAPIDIGSATARSLHRLARNGLLACVDAAMLSLAVSIGYLAWAAPIHQQSSAMYLELAPLLLLFVAGYARAGLYPGLGIGPVETLRRASFVTTFGFLILAAFSFVLKVQPLYSRMTFAIALTISLLLIPIGRAAIFYVAQNWRWWAEPVVIIGTGPRASRVMRDIQRASHLGYRPAVVVTCGPPAEAAHLEGVPVVGGLDRIPEVVARGIRVAFLEVEEVPTGPIIDQLQQSFHRVILLAEFHDLPVEGVQVRNLATLVGIEYTNNLLRPINQTVKRILDLTLGMFIFVLVAPVTLTAALLVLLIDGWPVLFRQDRPGSRGRRISVPKIRTMRRNAVSELEEHFHANPALRDEWRLRYKLRDDPRLIPVIGRLFRRFSIDELPQLWSVLRGDMSLVGPRPFPDYHLEQFTPRFQELRQSVRPGITGWWQIAVRSDGGIKEQQAFDTYYIRNWSVWFDLYILARTIMAVASGRGAY